MRKMSFYMFLILISIILITKKTFVESTPLDDYVYAPDPHYNFTLIESYTVEGGNVFIYNFTSQKWYDETVSDQSIWWHYLCIAVPEKIIIKDTAFMLIDGGSNHASPPDPQSLTSEIFVLVAVSLGMISVNLKQIPNEPIVFKKDPQQKSRDEDEIIAWTWKEFLDNQNDPYILLRMPMTKAAVRGMDAATEIALSKTGLNITKFMIGGASKRGWTTWTTAAVDKRVIAAVPMVMDLLNINDNMHHHYRSLGGWTFAFKPYYELNITARLDTPAIQAMQRIIDPISYFDRYINKKILVLNSLNDEFFIPDDSDYFWDSLVTATNGTVLARRLPNAEHSMSGHILSIFFSLRSFFLSIYYNKPLPLMKWIRPNNSTHGIIVATIDTVNGPAPIDAIVYYAKTLDGKRRDFRLLIASPDDPTKPIPHPVFWEGDREILKKEVTSTSVIYTAAFLKPLTGWLGFEIQVSFPGLDDSVLQVSTQVNIVPETFPYPDCYKESCLGTLV